MIHKIKICSILTDSDLKSKFTQPHFVYFKIVHPQKLDLRQNR